MVEIAVITNLTRWIGHEWKKESSKHKYKGCW